MARGRKSPFLILLSTAERAELERWRRSTTIQAGLALSAIARRLAVGRRIGRRWLQRVINKRIPGLSDKQGRGRKPGFSPRGGGPSGHNGRRATG
jgi:transposase